MKLTITLLITCALSLSITPEVRSQSVFRELSDMVCNCMGDNKHPKEAEKCLTNMEESFRLSIEQKLMDHFKVNTLEEVGVEVVGWGVIRLLFSECEGFAENMGISVPEGEIDTVKFIPTGQAAMMYNQITKTYKPDSVYKSGAHLVTEGDSFILFDVTEQRVEEEFDVLDADAFSMKVKVSVRYLVNQDSIPHLYRNYREDYQHLLVIPEVRSAFRRVFGKYSSSEIYSRGQSFLEKEVSDDLGGNAAMSPMTIRSILMDPLEFPHIIKVFIDGGLLDEYNQLKTADLPQKKKIIKKLYKKKTKAALSLIRYYWPQDPKDELNEYILELFLED